jgi:hypothetical protein
MAIQSNFPSIRPSLLLDFANSKRLDPRVTFTRASTATYYDGVTTAKAEENLLTRSEAFDDAAWAKANTTVSADAGAAPDGTTTADLMYPTTTGTFRSVARQTTTILNTTNVKVVSFFAKASGMSWLYTFDSSTGGRRCFFDVTNEVTGTTAANHTTSIVNFGGGWYRCIITTSEQYTGNLSIGVADADNSTTATASGTNGILLWGAQLEGRDTVTAYTATTTQAITNYVPRLLTAAAGVARFDHTPTTGASLGLLVEESRVNSLVRSQEFGTTWSTTRGTITADTAIAPDGTLTADKLRDTTDNNTHFVAQTFTGTAVAYTFTVFAKAGSRSFIALRLFDGTNQVGLAYYNLGTGATGTVTAGTATITNVGNGWYRCGLTATLAASASCTADIYLASADNTNSYAGNGYSGAFLWGAQVELGAFATSYIPTVASTVTRQADVASMTGTNFSSWFNNSEGTVYAEVNPVALGVGAGVVLNDNTTSNRIRVALNSASDQSLITTTGTAQATLDGGTPAAGSFFKVATAYKVNDFALSLDAGTVATDTAGTIPVVSQLQIGAETTTVGTSRIRKLAYYPLRLTNAQLQAITG